MPTIRLTTETDWQSVTLSADELWQVRGGSMLITNEAPLDPEQGMELQGGEVRFFKTGRTVHYRKPSGSTPTYLVREVE